MSNIFIQRAEAYSQVRIRLLGVDDETLISDDIINLYVPLAERLIQLKCTTWSAIMTAGGDNKQFLIDATIAMVCGMFVVPLRNIASSDVRIGEIAEKQSMNFGTMEKDFYAEVEFLLSKITTYSATNINRVGVITNTAMFESLE